MTLNPGQVDFGVVNRSTRPKVELTLTYAGGQADWAVTEMKTISDHVVAELERDRAGRPAGQVNYQLTATLKPSAPVGFFKDEITLETNDPSSPTHPGLGLGRRPVQRGRLALGDQPRHGQGRARRSRRRSWSARRQPFKLDGDQARPGPT